MTPADQADLADAIARGRLALAEVAAIPPRELDALYALAVQYLDSGRDQEAAELLAGLVALFPYAARTWRAYAIALHRTLDLRRARAAYQAALILEPNHPRTRCYRAEVLFYLGERPQAVAELGELTRAADAQVARRAAQLLQLIERLAHWTPPPPPQAGTSPAVGFCLPDQRPLPLPDGRFAAAPPTLLDEDSTATAKIFAPTEPTGTHTALLPRRGRPRRPAAQEGTDTARVIRRRAVAPRPTPGDREVTVQGGPPGASLSSTKSDSYRRASASPDHVSCLLTTLRTGEAGSIASTPTYESHHSHPPERLHRETTHTAVVLRKLNAPLSLEAGDAET